MRDFTLRQFERVYEAMHIYSLRHVDGLSWDEVAKASHWSTRRCYDYYNIAKKALSRFYGFDWHGSYK